MYGALIVYTCDSLVIIRVVELEPAVSDVTAQRVVLLFFETR